MRMVPVSTRSKQIAGLLRDARKENLILRAEDGTEFILAEIDDFDREIELTRQNRKLMKFLDLRAKKKEGVTLEEAKRSLGLR